MKCSIIIPARNEAERIAETLERALALEPFEVIVVDGESTDRTVEIATDFDCRVLTSAPGRGTQQNAGADIAGGEVVLFLHADCNPPPDTLQQIADCFEDSNNLYGAFEHTIDAEGRLFRMLERHDARRVRNKGIAYGDQGIFIRRNTFQAVGGFPDVPLMEDIRLMRALKKQFGSHPVLLPGPLRISARRWKKHGVIRQSIRNFMLCTAERWGVSPETLVRFYAPHSKSNNKLQQ